MPYIHCTWDFSSPSTNHGLLSVFGEPVYIRLICVLKHGIEYPQSPEQSPFLDVDPMFENDAIRSNASMLDYSGFHPGIDLGWHAGE